MPNYNPKFKDIAGQVFGRLEALEYVGTTRERPGGTKRRLAIWRCRCACGTELTVVGASLRNQVTRSCGCLDRETTARRSWKHGHTKSLTYRIWSGMLTRCYNVKRRDFRYYG